MTRNEPRTTPAPEEPPVCCYLEPVRHLPVALLIILYVLVIGQNWAHYAAALMIYLYDRYQGHWSSVPFKL